MNSKWKDSLSLILQSRKPILCTAHSQRDLDRDLAYVEELTVEDEQELVEPLESILV